MLSMMTFFLFSCDNFYFTVPQPVDKDNIYEFPAEYRGYWISVGNSSGAGADLFPGAQYEGLRMRDVAFSNNTTATYWQNDSSDELFLVEKKYALYIVASERMVLKGAWPRLDGKGGFLYPGDLATQKKITYDTLRRPVDTVDNYIVSGEYIYEVQVDGFLSRSYPYRSNGDTMIVLTKDTICIDLGQNAFLRKLSDHLYALNMRTRILGTESDWWQVRLVQRTSDNHLKMWTCNSAVASLPSMFYHAGTGKDHGDSYYLDSKWTSEQMLKLISEGYFEIYGDLIKPGSQVHSVAYRYPDRAH